MAEVAGRTESGEVEIKSPEEAAFVEHYDRLIGALPIVKLLPKFISARIISFGEQEKILAGETDADKRKRFLKYISDHFTTGKTYTFNKFLEVLEKHGGTYSYLATDMKKTLEQCKQHGEQESHVSHPVPVEEDEDTNGRNVQVTHEPSQLVMSPGRPPTGEENFKSINEPAELISTVTVTEERLSVVAQQKNNTTEVGQFHGSSRPELPDLIEHVGSFVSTKWYFLGLRLKVSTNTLDEIEKDNRDSSSTACRKMFQAWLRDNRNGTWNDVITALKSNSVGENGIAEKLEGMIT